MPHTGNKYLKKGTCIKDLVLRVRNRQARLIPAELFNGIYITYGNAL